jgi:hypothetical protein
MTVTDLVASLRQYAADKATATPAPKYSDADLRRIVARAIRALPQLQSPRDGSYVRAVDQLPIFFDAAEGFTNLVNIQIDGHLRLVNQAASGSARRTIAPGALRAAFEDLLFVYLEAKSSGTTGQLTIDLSFDGGSTFLKAGGFESILPLATYLDVSSYAKTGLILSFELSPGTLVVDSAQLFLLFLKRQALLDYSSSLEWYAQSIIARDLAQEAMAKGYDLTVINGLLLSSSELMRRATGRGDKGEPLERPQGQAPGLGLKVSQLGGQGRDGTDRTKVERTEYGKSVARVFG